MNRLNIDQISESEFENVRACHRVVRAMHDGHCPSCGYLDSAELFQRQNGDHVCPSCGFMVTSYESGHVMQRFQPYMKRAVEVFNRTYRG